VSPLLPADLSDTSVNNNNRQFLRELRDYQLAIKLFDESAEEIVREASRKQVETSLAAAVEIARSPGKARDPAAVVEVRPLVLCLARCGGFPQVLTKDIQQQS
jgi:hypothetical protein